MPRAFLAQALRRRQPASRSVVGKEILMRVAGIVCGAILVLSAATGGDARPRFTRCCVDLGIPEVPGPVCAQVRGRRRLRPARACRLIGGTPIGRGDCSIAACRRPS
jgi:hypothetical protein